MFGIVLVIVALVLIGVGIAAGFVAIGLAATLMGLGIVSSSIVAGFLAGRPQTGVRVFLIQCGLLAGIPAGALCAWILDQVSDHVDESWLVPVYGGLSGAFAGLIIALMLDFIFRRIHAWAETKLQSLP